MEAETTEAEPQQYLVTPSRQPCTGPANTQKAEKPPKRGEKKSEINVYTGLTPYQLVCTVVVPRGRGKKDKTMKKITFTENELRAVKVCLNYNDRESQICDNYSNGGVEEFKLELDWNDQQVGGLISSMTEKGIGYIDNEESDGIFWLTEDGINAYFDQLEKQGA